MTDYRKLLIEAEDAIAVLSDNLRGGTVSEYYSELRSRIHSALAEPVAEVHVIFDGPPSHESGRFVECENADGQSINAGRWEQRGKYWHLILNAAPAEQWRRVEDGLPESMRSVLVACPAMKNIYTAYYAGNSWFHFANTCGPLLEAPTHWTPLPALPEADK